MTDRMRKTGLALAALLLAGGAQAQGDGSGPAPIMSVAEIAAMLEAKGYTIREIELERGRYEVEMIDRNGMRVEGYLSAVDGAPLPFHERDDFRRGPDRDHDTRYRRGDE